MKLAIMVSFFCSLCFFGRAVWMAYRGLSSWCGLLASALGMAGIVLVLAGSY
jgi:hypothetical protein